MNVSDTICFIHKPDILQICHCDSVIIGVYLSVVGCHDTLHSLWQCGKRNRQLCSTFLSLAPAKVKDMYKIEHRKKNIKDIFTGLR